MLIETERLIVRTFREDDVAALYQIAYDPDVLEYCPDLLKRDVTEAEVLAFIRDYIRIDAENDIDTRRCYAIENRETGDVMGCITFGKNHMLNEYEIGWMMRKQYTKKGYASEAAQAYAEYFCAAYGVEYLIVVMDVGNLLLTERQKNADSSCLKSEPCTIITTTDTVMIITISDVIPRLAPGANGFTVMCLLPGAVQRFD